MYKYMYECFQMRLTGVHKYYRYVVRVLRTIEIFK